MTDTTETQARNDAIRALEAVGYTYKDPEGKRHACLDAAAREVGTRGIIAELEQTSKELPWDQDAEAPEIFRADAAYLYDRASKMREQYQAAITVLETARIHARKAAIVCRAQARTFPEITAPNGLGYDQVAALREVETDQLDQALKQLLLQEEDE